MVSRSWLTLAVPENLAKLSGTIKRQSVSERGLRGPTSCLGVQKTDVDMRIIFQFFKFMRNIISDEGEGQSIIFLS
jgi:hypothetical protein